MTLAHRQRLFNRVEELPMYCNATSTMPAFPSYA